MTARWRRIVNHVRRYATHLDVIHTHIPTGGIA